jgi:hypothetical protein
MEGGMEKMQTLIEVLMERDGLSLSDACNLIRDAQDDLRGRLENGEFPSEICMEWFGLEEDRLLEII